MRNLLITKTIFSTQLVMRNIVVKFSSRVPRASHQIFHDHVKKNSPLPLMQNVRSSWPDAVNHPLITTSAASSPDGAAKIIPPRTVSEDKLSFRMRTSFTHGTDIFYPHMQINPADYKVALFVSLPCFLTCPIH